MQDRVGAWGLTGEIIFPFNLAWKTSTESSLAPRNIRKSLNENTYSEHTLEKQ